MNWALLATILRLLAAGLGLLSLGNAASFGSRLYGADPVDWSQLLYAALPALGGLISWAGSAWLGWKITDAAASELIAAVAAWLPGWLAGKEELVARRRLLVAVWSVIESINGWEELDRVRAAMPAPNPPPAPAARMAR